MEAKNPSFYFRDADYDKKMYNQLSSKLDPRGACVSLKLAVILKANRFANENEHAAKLLSELKDKVG